MTTLITLDHLRYLKDRIMVITEHGDCIFNEDDVIKHLYQNPNFDIAKLYINDIVKYNTAIKQLSINLPYLNEVPQRGDLKQFDSNQTDEWYMPVYYKNIDVKKYLLDKCNNEEERDRVLIEYKLFEQKGFIKVLKFLIYFVDVLRSNNIVWGVGRGSSVSSFCLFLIGVHKINPLLYNLDYREFLR